MTGDVTKVIKHILDKYENLDYKITITNIPGREEPLCESGIIWIKDIIKKAITEDISLVIYAYLRNEVRCSSDEEMLRKTDELLEACEVIVEELKDV